MKAKPFVISKQLVMQAYRLVKANRGAAGVDHQSLDDFEEGLKSNLYRLWNRMSSGSYFPAPVKAVSIPKKSGGERVLGVPTVADRVAQMVVKLQIEPDIEPHFLNDSYGYRPGKSALDAVGVTRKRCWRYAWVVEFDIRGLFDNIPHALLLKAVRKHVQCHWALLYVERWLTAPQQQPDGCVVPRCQGTPQGGVVSPLLSNLFLHYVFDVWMTRHFPTVPWCRYADDGLFHCHSQQQAREICEVLRRRFRECGLELHPQKTKIVYCKDGKRRGTYPVTTFDFLGYTFRGRTTRGARGGVVLQLQPCGQYSGPEVHAPPDQEIESPQPSGPRPCGDRPRVQPGVAGLDQLLRAIQSVCAVSVLEVLQPHPARMGHAQIRPLSREEDQSGTVLGTDGQGSPWTVCALALRDDRCVRLMGAV